MESTIKRALDAARERTNEGVAPHSRGSQYFIFCVGQDPVRIAAFIGWAFYEKVNIKPLVGKYEGKTERSFIANMDRYEDIEPFLKHEDSILVLHSYNARDTPQAKLVYQNGKVEHLGRLHAVTKEQAMQCASWTFDPLSGVYFITGE